MKSVQFLLALPFSLRQRKLAKTRPPIERDEFAEMIARRGGDPEAAAWVFDKLRKEYAIDEFWPRPEDDFGRVFGLGDEDLDEDFVLAVFEHLGLAAPKTEDVVPFGAIDTPLRLAQFVSERRKSVG